MWFKGFNRFITNSLSIGLGFVVGNEGLKLILAIWGEDDEL
jgi:hypothetical protein